MTDFYLAYHGSSKEYADILSKRLEKSQYKIAHIAVLGEAGPYLSERLVTLKRPILFLVSDNLLKSTICMYDALNVLKSLIKDELIYPIVVKGNYGQGSGNKKVETHFTKVGDVINYMNHWRDIFLESRKEKRNFLNGDKEEHSKRLQELRAISAETGEYLRLLRDVEHIRFEDIIESDFELLFQFLSRQKYVALNPKDVTPGSTTAQVSDSGKQSVKDTVTISDAFKDEGFKEVKEVELDLSNGFEDELISQKPLEEITIPIEDIPEKPIEEEFGGQNMESAEFDHTDQIIEDSIGIFEEKQYEAGLLFLEDYLKYNPTNVKVRMHLANMRYDFGNKSQAADDIREILKLDNENILAHKWLAEYLEIKEDHSAALHHLLQIQKLDPGGHDIDYKIGLILKNNIKDINSAKQYFESALAKNPGDKKSLFQLGLIKKEQGEIDDAKTLLGKSLEAEDALPESDHELAKIFLQSDDLQKVIYHWGRAKIQDPDLKDPKIEYFIARTKKKIKQKKRLQNIQKVVEKAKVKVNRNTKSLGEKKKKKPKKRKLKTILITGATSGIGRACAIELGTRGHRLILTGRRPERLEKLEKELGGKPDRIVSLNFDVRDFEACKVALKKLTGKMENIDVLINNAGLAQGKDPIHKADVEDWNTMIDTNIKGILHMTRLVAPGMAKRKKGHIINIGSTAGREVYPGGSVYCASKYAVNALTKGTRMDLHKYNIRVSQVSPGAVEETEFAQVRFHGDEERAKIYEHFTPINSRDVAKVVRFIITRPLRVNIEDILMMGTQQASALIIDKSGRKNG